MLARGNGVNVRPLQEDWTGAAERYTEAIALDSSQAVYYLNRAACNAHLGRHELVVADAKKAVELDKRSFKAWYRLGKTLHEHFQDLTGSIAAYDKAIANVPANEEEVKKTYGAERALVFGKIRDPCTMPIEAFSALARAHDIPVPLSSGADDAAIRQSILANPKFSTQPMMRFLLIPQDQTAPLHQIELASGPTLEKAIEQQLGCNYVCSETLYSEEHFIKMGGNEDGVGIGKTHTAYSFWMDDNAVPARPLNPRASALLRRPDVHGPVLVQKTTFFKTDNSPFASKPEDVLCTEGLTEAELKSDEFRDLRGNWLQRKTVANRDVAQMLSDMGVTSLNMNP